MDQHINDHQILAWKSAKAMVYLSAVVGLVVILSWHFARGYEFWQWYVTDCVLLFFVALVFRNRNFPVWISSSIFIVSAILCLFANTLTNYDLALRGVRFDSFTGYKILPLAIALIAPNPIWVGYFLISITSISPLILYYWVFPFEFRAMISVQEPWMTSIYGIVSYFVLRYRHNNIEMERKMSRLDAEQRAIKDLAQLFLGLRDMMNTPLQSIELTASLLNNESLPSKSAAAYLERSLIRLRELSQILSSYEENVDWDEAGSAFSAVVLLEQKLNEMRPHDE